jgi:hypothetical protein
MIYFLRVRLPPLELDRPEDRLPLLLLRLLPLDLDTEPDRLDEPLLDDDLTLRPDEDLLRLPPDLDEEPDELLRTRLDDEGAFRVVGLRTAVDRGLDFLTRLPLLVTLGRVEVRLVVRSTPALEVDFLTRVEGATRVDDWVDFATLVRSEASLRTLRLPPGSSTPTVLDVLLPVLETAEPSGA